MAAATNSKSIAFGNLHIESESLIMDAIIKKDLDGQTALRPSIRSLTEIVRNGLIAVTEEMKINLMRTAYNMIIYEALDFTVGLFDAEGNTVSIGLGLPMFIRGMSETVKAKIAHFGTRIIEPGDILLTNDAYIDRQPPQPHDVHGADLPRGRTGRLLLPAWRTGRTSAARSTASTTDIYSEGLQMPIVKIYRKGVPNEELIVDHHA